MRCKRKTFALFGLLMMAVSVQVMAQQNQEPEPMGFFITSVGPGNGADLGGLEGAAAHRQSPAEAGGPGDPTSGAARAPPATRPPLLQFRHQAHGPELVRRPRLRPRQPPGRGQPRPKLPSQRAQPILHL